MTGLQEGHDRNVGIFIVDAWDQPTQTPLVADCCGQRFFAFPIIAPCIISKTSQRSLTVAWSWRFCKLYCV